jgi:tripartite-type tricarboxylate transporter receptor subunit TctC
MQSRRSFLQAGIVAASTSTFGALAQDAKPLSIIVGFPPGGSPDFVARTLAEKLAQKLKRPVVVENKVGAGGQLALAALMNAASDGSVYALTPAAMMTTGPLLYSKLPYDITKIEPVLTACKIEHGVVVGPGAPAKTVSELLAWMKATPNKAFYGIPAAGTSPHFVGMLLARAAGVDAQAVLYRGGPPMVADLLGGQVPAAVNVLSNFVEHHRSGKLRVLATSGTSRSPLLQDVPTLAEVGFPQAQVEDWYGFMTNVGTPKAETAAFAKAVREVLELNDVRTALQNSGHNPYVLDANDLAKDIVTSQKRWAEIIKITGFKLES